jgi:hypothetical protein
VVGLKVVGEGVGLVVGLEVGLEVGEGVGLAVGLAVGLDVAGEDVGDGVTTSGSHNLHETGQLACSSHATSSEIPLDVEQENPAPVVEQSERKREGERSERRECAAGVVRVTG